MPNITKKVFVSKKITDKKVSAKKPAAKKAVAKKVVKKAPVKKVVAKKVTKKVPAKTSAKKVTLKKPVKDLVFSNNDQSFWLSDGQILNSLIALEEAFQNMNDEVFFHHVNNGRNDFAEWVDLVLCDGDCAVELRKVDTKDKSYGVVKKYLKTYKK